MAPNVYEVTDLDFTDLVTRLRASGCVFAEDEAALLVEAAPDPSTLESLVARRVEGEPLEVIVGWAEFAGFRVPVAPGIFVPRKRTELVARIAAELAPPMGVAVDLCCGSGAIALAIATWRPDVTVYASDIDPAAVRLAQRALDPMAGTAFVSDMDKSLPGSLIGRVDVIASCPPYVPTGQIALMPAEAREFEPLIALDGGHDGTDMQAMVFKAARTLLIPGGACVVETSAALVETTVAIAVRNGLTATVERDQLLGAVVVVAQLP